MYTVFYFNFSNSLLRADLFEITGYLHVCKSLYSFRLWKIERRTVQCDVYNLHIMQDRHGRFLASKAAIVMATSQAHAAAAAGATF